MNHNFSVKNKNFINFQTFCSLLDAGELKMTLEIISMVNFLEFKIILNFTKEGSSFIWRHTLSLI